MTTTSTKDVKPGDTVWRVDYYMPERPPIRRTAVAVAASGRVSIMRGRNGQPVYDDDHTFATYEEARALIIHRAEMEVASARKRLASVEGDLNNALAIPEHAPEDAR